MENAIKRHPLEWETDPQGVIIDGCGLTSRDKMYYSGKFVDLCGLPVGEYMKPDGGNAGGGGGGTVPEDPGRVKITIIGENDPVQKKVVYRAVADKAVGSDVEVTAKVRETVEGGQDIVHEMVFTILSGNTDSTGTHEVAYSKEEPEYTNSIVVKGEGDDKIYTVEGPTKQNRPFEILYGYNRYEYIETEDDENLTIKRYEVAADTLTEEDVRKCTSLNVDPKTETSFNIVPEDDNVSSYLAYEILALPENFLKEYTIFENAHIEGGTPIDVEMFRPSSIKGFTHNGNHLDVYTLYVTGFGSQPGYPTGPFHRIVKNK